MVGPSPTLESLGWRLAAEARKRGFTDLTVRVRDGELESIDAYVGDEREFYTLGGDGWLRLVSTL